MDVAFEALLNFCFSPPWVSKKNVEDLFDDLKHLTTRNVWNTLELWSPSKRRPCYGTIVWHFLPTKDDSAESPGRTLETWSTRRVFVCSQLHFNSVFLLTKMSFKKIYIFGNTSSGFWLRRYGSLPRVPLCQWWQTQSLTVVDFACPGSGEWLPPWVELRVSTVKKCGETSPDCSRLIWNSTRDGNMFEKLWPWNCVTLFSAAPPLAHIL